MQNYAMMHNIACKFLHNEKIIYDNLCSILALVEVGRHLQIEEGRHHMTRTNCHVMITFFAA